MDFGKNIADWLTSNISALYFVLVGVMALVFLFRQEFGRLLGWLVGALIVGLMVINPGNFLQNTVAFIGHLVGA